MDTVAPKLFRLVVDLPLVILFLRTSLEWRVDAMQIHSSTFTGAIRPVGRRNEAHTPCGTSPEIAHIVDPLLDIVCRDFVLVVLESG